MLTLYRPSRGEDDGVQETKKVIPAGSPYLTKVNGKLAMARAKKDKPANVVIDLLGEAFGVRNVVHRRVKSTAEQPEPLLIRGVPYVPQQQLTYAAATPNPGFSSNNMVLPQPKLAVYPLAGLSKPTQQDFEKLRQIDAHFNNYIDKDLQRGSSHKELAIKTSITVTKHICANCGRLRSRKYHRDHPIKPGETLPAEFCRKCQKDASSTSSSSSRSKGNRKRKGKKKASKNKRKGKEIYISSSSDTDETNSAGLELQRTLRPRKGWRYVQPYDDDKEYFSDGSIKPDRRRSGRRYTQLGNTIQARRRGSELRGSRRRSRQIFEYPAASDGSSSWDEVRSALSLEEDRGRSLSPYSYDIAPTYHKGSERGSTSKYRSQTDTQVRKVGRRTSISSIDNNINGSITSIRTVHPDYGLDLGRVLSREPSLDRDMLTTLAHPYEASQRRRRERSSSAGSRRYLKGAHTMYPREDDDVVVLREEYTHPPRRELQQGRRRQEYVDRATLEGRRRISEFSAEEAARYYHDDWTNTEPERGRSRTRASELVPIEDWQGSPSSLGRDSNSNLTALDGYVPRAVSRYRSPSSGEVSKEDRSASRASPGSVGGSPRALVIPRRRSRARGAGDDETGRGLAARPRRYRIVEVERNRGGRGHVRFQEPRSGQGRERQREG